MRRAEKDELRGLSVFLAEQFYEIEPFQTAMQGIEPQKAKMLIAEKYYGQLSRSLYGRADIFISGSKTGGIINGAIIGIDGKKRLLFSYVPIMINLIKIAFKMCTKTERKLIIRNMRPIKDIQSAKWVKSISKEPPYYLAVFAIAKASRGGGLCREMLEGFFDHAKAISSYIALETHTDGNVPIYEHFGFELVESKNTADGAVTEYRMVRKI